MDRYSPLWNKIVDSSLWDEPDFVVKVFLTMIAKKDLDNIVRGTAYNISRWARKTEPETIEALRILSSPDTKRLEPQEYEGRRIEKVEDGWLVLNGERYRKLMQDAHRRENQRVWIMNKRARERTKKSETRTSYGALGVPRTQKPS